MYFPCLLLCLACDQPAKVEKHAGQLELESIIQLMDYDLATLEREIISLGKFSTELFDKPRDINSNYIFIDGANNAAPNHDDNFSTLYISELTEDEIEAQGLAELTAPLDSAFKKLVESNVMLSQVYLNSKIQFSRLYPPYDPYSLLDRDLDLTAYNFFYEADEIRNPNREAVWIEEIYVDPAGKGWILTLIYPVYNGNKLSYVIGFDITIKDIIDQYFEKTQRQLIIIDGTGTVVAGKSRAIEALSLPPLKNHTYTHTIRSDSFRIEDFNLFKSKSKEVRSMASKLILGNEKSYILNDNGVNWHVSSKGLDRLNWFFLDLELQ